MKTPKSTPLDSPLVKDFRKIITTLNSSATVEHIMTSDRMFDLFRNKWRDEVKKDKEAMEMVVSFTEAYGHQREAVLNNLAG